MKSCHLIFVWLALVLFALSPATQADAAELIMFERDGCQWCAEWDSKIGITYNASPQGQKAPLRRIDIFTPLPDDLADIQGTRFTPTFVLIDQGKEIGRIPGYPGEALFWKLLDEMLAKVATR